MPRALDPSMSALLKRTSRTFYLSLRVLPAAVRPQIGLAYLLARSADTIADTELVPPNERLDALRRLREGILGQNAAPLNFGDLARQQGSPAERLLLEQAGQSIASLQSLSPDDMRLVRQVLETITSGQELDLRRFAAASSGNIVALSDETELDDYTYRVAGCVGEFWTHLCLRRLLPNGREDRESMLTEGKQFGKGLQLVNILRDLPADLRKGRCYLPADKLAEIQLTPADLLQPAREGQLRPLYNRYLDLAETNLAAGWRYTNRWPPGCARVRLACAWPILIGLKTIGRLRQSNVLDSEHRVKISRGEVWTLILQSLLYHLWPGAWPRLVSPVGKAVASEHNFS